MMTRVYELWLTSASSRHPFAVLVEDGERCAWTVATDTDGRGDRGWSQSIVEGWGRNEDDAWVLDAWRDFLEDIASASPDERQAQLQKLDQSTAGVEVRRRRRVSSRLPPQALADRWRRNRLGAPHDAVAAAIAAHFGRGGKIHWRASIEISKQSKLQGEWIVENHAERGIPVPSEGSKPDATSQASAPAALVSGAAGLAVVSIVETKEVETIKKLWLVTKRSLTNEYPFGIAVVRDSRHVELLEQGCIVGARFAAPVSMAVAAARHQWNRARCPDGYRAR